MAPKEQALALKEELTQMMGSPCMDFQEHCREGAECRFEALWRVEGSGYSLIKVRANLYRAQPSRIHVVFTTNSGNAVGCNFTDAAKVVEAIAAAIKSGN